MRALAFAQPSFCPRAGTIIGNDDVAKSQTFQRLFHRLAAAEERVFAGEFLAPMLRGGVAHVRIAGVVCRLRVEPPDFKGWGVFRPQSPTAAELVRPAGLAERQQYLELLPLVRMLVCGREADAWLAVPAHQADARFRFDGLIPVRLAEEVQMFEVLLTRFDGAHCWYEGPDPRHDPATAAFLREALGRLVAPERLSRSGLTAEERAAYARHYWARVKAEEEVQRDRTEERLRVALAHAGAEFRDYRDHGDVYRVTYHVDGQRHVSAVSRRDLSVRVAGICLSGHDHRFDLNSLVGVLREAHQAGAVLQVGDANRGMTEGDYWNVHPPQR